MDRNEFKEFINNFSDLVFDLVCFKGVEKMSEILTKLDCYNKEHEKELVDFVIDYIKQNTNDFSKIAEIEIIKEVEIKEKEFVLRYKIKGEV